MSLKEEIDRSIHEYGILAVNPVPSLSKNESNIDSANLHILDDIFVSLNSGETFGKTQWINIIRKAEEEGRSKPIFLRIANTLALKDSVSIVAPGEDGYRTALSNAFNLVDSISLCIGGQDVGDPYSSSVPRSIGNLVDLILSSDVLEKDTMSAIREEPTKVDGFLMESPNVYMIKQEVTYTHTRGVYECMACGRAENLWIHVKDGFIGCGRFIYGMKDTGCITRPGESYREGAAVTHFDEDPTSCLVIKLATIRLAEDGKVLADVNDYSMDELVSDTLLEEHLRVLGVPIPSEATEKTMAQLEKEQKNFDWTNEMCDIDGIDRPDDVGLNNLGDTCFMSSVLQLLCRCEGAKGIFNQYYEHTRTKSLDNKCHGFLDSKFDQLVKVSRILTKADDGYLNSCHRKHQLQEEMLEAVLGLNKITAHEMGFPKYRTTYAPKYFRRVWCFDRFETGQHDAEEFLYYVLSNECGNMKAVKNLFDIKAYRVIRCMKTQSYKVMPDNLLSISLSIGSLSGVVSMMEQQFITGDVFEFRSFKSGETSMAQNTVRLHHELPKYIWITVQRQFFTELGELTKTTEDVEVPDILDLTPFINIQTEEGDSLFLEEGCVTPQQGEGVNCQMRLKGAIVHLGASQDSGHYIAYFKDKDHWLIYNDGKVCESTEPYPATLRKGYMFLYEAM